MGEVTYPGARVRARRSSPRRLDVDTFVASVLIGGLLASVAVIVIGLLWLFARTHALPLDDALPPTDVLAFALGGIRRAATPDVGPRRLVYLGIGILMLTPYLRVLTSLLYFLAVRNWRYALFTSVVLLVLTYGML